jgi:hypothetical protein
MHFFQFWFIDAISILTETIIIIGMQFQSDTSISCGESGHCLTCTCGACRKINKVGHIYMAHSALLSNC